MIYLDNAATTLRKPPCVIDAVVQAMQTMGNSGRSAHAESLAAARTIFAAREALAALFGCPQPDHVCLTANSTEALNIAISGLLAPGDHVLSTDLEHNSVLRPLYRQMERGVQADFLPADRQGRINYADFDRLLRPETKAVVCTAGSNLTGNLLDLQRIGDFCAAHGIVLRHRFLLWCQGESDGDHHTAPDVYAEQFCRMYETLRRENIEHCFLIGIGEYNGPAADISYDAIRNAQYALADHRSDLTVVSRSFETMKVRGLMKDAFHYYQAGYNETGRTAGEACAVFVEKSYPLR